MCQRVCWYGNLQCSASVALDQLAAATQSAVVVQDREALCKLLLEFQGAAADLIARRREYSESLAPPALTAGVVA